VNTLRYLWTHPYGRLALLLVAVGLLGLVAHYWTGFILLAGLRLPTAPYDASVTRQSIDDQMAKILDVSEASDAGNPITRHE
jgi:hypothetical protein